MESPASQSKLAYWSTSVCAIFISLFVIVIASSTLGFAFDSVSNALADGPSLFQSQSYGFHFGDTMLPLVIGFVLILVIAALTFTARVVRSNNAIMKCSKDGTVILEPNYGFAITRYLFSEVVVDLSRTDFELYKPDQYPFGKIHRLVEVRLRETNIPDEMVDSLLVLRRGTRIDLSFATLSDSSAAALAKLNGIEISAEGVTESNDDTKDHIGHKNGN